VAGRETIKIFISPLACGVATEKLRAAWGTEKRIQLIFFLLFLKYRSAGDFVSAVGDSLTVRGSASQQ